VSLYLPVVLGDAIALEDDPRRFSHGINTHCSLVATAAPTDTISGRSIPG
jgi:hypothetical protein